MDTAVGLIQAYLRLNGFFTVTEYPIITRSRSGSRTLTDIDVLAMRFPGAERWVSEPAQRGEALPADPKLALGEDRLQMIIGEVKEGKARFKVISLKHVITYLSRYLDQYRDVFLSAQFKDEALGLMALLVKLDLKL